MTMQNMSIQSCVVTVLSILILFGAEAQATSLFWANGTSGDWIEDRWLLDNNMNTGSYVCCPGPSDDVIINVPITSFHESVISKMTNVSSVSVQFSNPENVTFGFLTITDPQGGLIPWRSIILGERAVLWIDSFKILRIPNDSVALVNSTGVIVLANGTVTCFTPGCSILFDNGSIKTVTYSAAIFTSVTVIARQSFYATTIDRNSQLGFFNANVSISTVMVENIGGLYFIRNSLYRAEFCVFQLSTSKLDSVATLKIESSSFTIADSHFRAPRFVHFYIYGSSQVNFIASDRYSLDFYFGYGSRFFVRDTSAVYLGGCDLLFYQNSSLDLLQATLYAENSDLSLYDYSGLLITSNSTLSLVSSSIAVTNNSFISLLHNSTLTVEIGVRLIDPSLYRCSFPISPTNFVVYMQSIILDPKSVLICNSSNLNAELLHLGAVAWIDKCLVTLNGPLSSAAGADIVAFTSTVNIESSAVFEGGTHVWFTDNSAVTVEGDLSLDSSQFTIHNSNMTIIGGFISQNCTRANLTNIFPSPTYITIPNTLDGLSVFISSKVTILGRFDAGKDSFTFFGDSALEIGGLFSLGENGILGTVRSDVKIVKAALSFGKNSVSRLLQSAFLVDQGNMTLAPFANLTLVWTHSEIQSGSFVLEAGASLIALHSSLNISGGDIYVAGLPWLGKFILYGIVANEGRIDISGGNIFLNGWATLIAVGQQGVVSVKRGSILVTNYATIFAALGGSFLVDGGDISVESQGDVIADTNGFIHIKSGNVVIRDNSRLTAGNNSQIIVSGSVFIQETSFIILNGSSTLDVQNGSIILDRTSSAQIDGNSSIIGVGTVQGSVYVYSGRVTYKDGSRTILSLGALNQTSESMMEVALSSDYVNGSSTHVSAEKIFVSGSLTVRIDDNMQSRLMGGQIIELMSASDLSGSFLNVEFLANPSLRCGMTVRATAKSLNLLFDPTLCVDPTLCADSKLCSSPAQASGAELATSNSVGIAVGVSVSIAVMIIVIVLVVKFRVSAFKFWKSRQRQVAEKLAIIDSEVQDFALSQHTSRASVASNWKAPTVPVRLTNEQL